MIHIYTGENKGKTTAALGLALRAAGRGMDVIIAQFLKGRDTGELHTLSRIPNITLLRNSRDYGFVFNMSSEDRERMTAEQNANLDTVIESRREGVLLVLDEAIAAYTLNTIDRSKLEALLDDPRGAEIVLTGRDAPQNLIDKADYVTEMRKIKHPFDEGKPARRGIEF